MLQINEKERVTIVAKRETALKTGVSLGQKYKQELIALQHRYYRTLRKIQDNNRSNPYSS